VGSRRHSRLPEGRKKEAFQGVGTKRRGVEAWCRVWARPLGAYFRGQQIWKFYWWWAANEKYYRRNRLVCPKCDYHASALQYHDI